MQAQILKANEADEYFFAEGCFILELSNSAADPDVSVARARVKPGVTTHWHRLTGVAERYVILSGSAEVEIGDLERRALSAGDVVIIPPLCRQRIINTGADDLVFLAICSPRFIDSVYQGMNL